MLKSKQFLNRSLALVLCLVLLVSCWVFTAPSANALRSDYTYKVELKTTNSADCNDGDKPYVILWGRGDNGTGSEVEIFNNTIDYDYFQKEKTYECSGTSELFPTRVSGLVTLDKGGWRKWVGEITLYINGTKVLNGVEVSGETPGLGVFSATSVPFEASVSSGNYPSARDCYFTKTPPATLTAPRTDEESVVVDIAAECMDQYGVSMSTISPRISFKTNIPGVVLTNTSMTIGSDCHTSNGTDREYILKVNYSNYGREFTGTIVNASYTYEFQDEAGNKLSSGSLKYGTSVPAPEVPVKDYTDSVHYVFKNWDNATASLTKDTVFKPLYHSESHSLNSYVYDGNATCTADGTKTATCSCGFTDTIPAPGTALSHSYTSVVSKKPTCTEPGEMTFSCIRGDHSYTTVLPAEGHSFIESEVAATCTEQGYTLHDCANCEESYKDNFIEALGHAWDEGTVSTAPDCTNEGSAIYSCTRCHESKTETLEALGHDFRSWDLVEPATCTQAGLKISTCVRCQKRLSEEIPALGHKWSEWEQDGVADCTHGAKLTRSCSTCNSVDTKNIEPLGHDMVLKEKQPDDGSNGILYYECARGCGQYATCKVDEGGNPSVGTECLPEEVETLSAPIPATTFNNYVRPTSHFNYTNRGGSLRVDWNSPADIQLMRFASSLLIPKGVKVIDFGYIYSRSDKIKNFDNFIIGGKNVEATSIFTDPEGHYSSYETAQGEVKTFNIVLAIEKPNWSYEYVARPYVVYEYAGQTFTIYDQCYAERSVLEIAEAVLSSPYETRMVKQYINDKIING